MSHAWGAWGFILIPLALGIAPSCTAPQSGPGPLVEQGRGLYLVSCAACHLTKGQGLEAVAPPLAGTPWPNEPEERLARIVLHGLRGPITVAGRKYNLEMPAMGFFSDKELAAILSYIRYEWGRPSHPVTPEAIARVRAANRDRSDSWTIGELPAAP